MSTSAVQVAQKSMPKVLRVGIVREGKVVREHVCKPGETVIAGSVPDAQVEVSGEGVPARLELFAARGSSYFLQVPEGVDGKIQWSDGVKGIEQLRALPEVKQLNGLTIVPLDESSRGKVVIATTSVLFQFVDAPPEPLKPISPADFKPKLFDEEDPLFVGLLLLFSGVACVFMLAVQFIEVPPESDAELLERARELVIEKIERVELADPNAVSDTKVEEKAEEKKVEEKKAEAKASEGSEAKAPSVETLARRSLLIAALGTAGEGVGAASDVLGDAGASRLAGALSGISGVEAATAGTIGLASGTGGGAGDATVAVGTAGGGDAATGAMAVKIKKPKVDYGTADIDADATDVDSIQKVVKSKKTAVTSCTEQALKTNPGLNGRVTVAWNIQAGKVTGVRVVENSTGDGALGECIARQVRTMRFVETLTTPVDGYTWIVSGA